MPFFPAGGTGARDEVKPRPDYLVEEDPEGVWLGGVPPHSTGVLGAEDR